MSEPPGNALLVQQFLAERDAPCPGCGYNLRGNEGQVCPECARPIELQLREPDGASVSRRLVLVALWMMAVAGLGSGLSNVMLMVQVAAVPGMPGYVWAQCGSGLLFGLAQSGLCLWGVWGMRQSRAAGRAAALGSAVRLLLVLLVAHFGLVFFWSVAWPLVYWLLGA